MRIEDIGLTDYDDALALMEERHARLVRDPDEEEVILVTSHRPVVTMGNRERDDDMKIARAHLSALGIAFAKIDRGGSVTVHEPGQLVVYPLVRLDARTLTVKRFVWALEQAMIDICAHHGVSAVRDAINPGVWVGANKIGALGIRVHERVSKHGLAFNAINSLATFNAIVPCGIRGRGVTTLAQETDIKATKFKDELYVSVEEALPMIVQKHIEAVRAGLTA